MHKIPVPDSFQLTNNWYSIQYTNLHQHHANVSQEYNKLLKAHGRGSFFIIKGFKLGLFKATLNGIETCIAKLTPGIYVHDWTIIDYVQPLKKSGLPIYIKVFDETDLPGPKHIYKIGSRYYHGVYGDGINAVPTYSILQSIRGVDDHTNFRTFYRLSLTDLYGSNGDKIDIDNINVDDFRFPPNDKDPSDPDDPWDPHSPNDNGNGGGSGGNATEDLDYTTLVARSQAITWSIVMDNHDQWV